jgi:hypothetical protein
MSREPPDVRSRRYQHASLNGKETDVTSADKTGNSFCVECRCGNSMSRRVEPIALSTYSLHESVHDPPALLNDAVFHPQKRSLCQTENSRSKCRVTATSTTCKVFKTREHILVFGKVRYLFIFYHIEFKCF